MDVTPSSNGVWESIVALFVAVMGLAFKGVWDSRRRRNGADGVANMSERLAVVESRINDVTLKFSRIEQQLQHLDTKIDRLIFTIRTTPREGR